MEYDAREEELRSPQDTYQESTIGEHCATSSSAIAGDIIAGSSKGITMSVSAIRWGKSRHWRTWFQSHGIDRQKRFEILHSIDNKSPEACVFRSAFAQNDSANAPRER